MKKHLLAGLMSVFMVFTALSTTAFAQDTGKTMTSKEFLAQSNDTDAITLTEDITLSDSLIVDKNYKINLSGHTLKFTKDSNLIRNNSNVIFQNGTLIFDNIQGKADCLLGVGSYSDNSTLTLDAVTLNAKDYLSPYALIYVYNESILNIQNNSTINATNELSLSGGVLKTAGTKGKVNIIDSTLNFENTIRGFLDGTINIKNSKVAMTGTNDGLDNGINSTPNGLDLTVDNSTITITGCTGRALTIDGSKVNLINGSVIELSNSNEGDIRFKSEGIISIDEKSELNFETVKLDNSIATKPLSDLIKHPSGYSYEVDENGNVAKVCKHLGTTIVNQKEASCTEEGYTGDEICTDCNEVIYKGSIITKLEHNFENGYCSDCNEKDPNFKSDESVNPGQPEQSENPEQPEVNPEQPEINPEQPEINPGQPEQPENTNPENNQDTVAQSPNTGDSTNLYSLLGMLLLSTIGIVYSSQKIFA